MEEKKGRFPSGPPRIEGSIGVGLGVSDNERREGRIAFVCTLGAKALLVLGVIFNGWADDGTGAGEFLVGLALLPLWLVAVTLEVAGLVYGIGGRKTTFGRWGIGLSCLSLGVIITLAWALGHR